MYNGSPSTHAIINILSSSAAAPVQALQQWFNGLLRLGFLAHNFGERMARAMEIDRFRKA
jgi:hypothetical protein